MRRRVPGVNHIVVYPGINAGTVTYPPGGRFGPRRQGQYQLHCQLAGSVQVTLGNTARTLNEGWICLLRPDCWEFFEYDSQRACRQSWIAVDPEYLAEGLRARLDRAAFSAPLSMHQNTLSDMIVSLTADEFRGRAEVLKALARLSLELYCVETLGSDGSGGKVQDAAVAVKSYMHRHLASPISLRDLAREADMTASSLVRLFTRHEGRSPMAYLWDLRTRHGIWLLKCSGFSVTEIAERVGFGTPFHFSRRVKQATRRSPVSLRRKFLTARRTPGAGASSS